MDQEKIGRFISEQRKSLGMTQMQLAEKLGISNRAVSKWETGKSMPDYSILKELCKVLNVSVNDLLNGETVMEKNEYDENLIRILNDYNRLKKRMTAFLVALLAAAALLVPFGVYKAFDAQYNLHSGLSSFMNVDVSESAAKTRLGTLDGREVYTEGLENASFSTVSAKKITLSDALEQNMISVSDLERKALYKYQSNDKTVLVFENYEICVGEDEVLFRPVGRA